MSEKLFGTDGIRGRFGEPPLTQPYVEAIGIAVARWLKEGGAAAPTIVLAGDTRESTPQLADWLTSGLRAESRDLKLRLAGTDTCGVLPTPAVAYLTRSLGADLGIALSASHNPFHDNGIKFFDRNGLKFDDATESAIEIRIAQALAERAPQTEGTTKSQGEGEAQTEGAPDADLAALYRHYLTHSLGSAPEPISGLRVVLDTGNGAASALAEPVFQTLGAHTELLFAQPNGRNINDNCGSTAPQVAANKVREVGADLGFAFDGDADRVIVVDEQGRVRDGDEVLFLWAKSLVLEGALPQSAIVATSMSNLGLERALAEHDVVVHRCDVGDRAVVSMLRSKSLRLGGEQSGHIVDLEQSTTGDGLLTAIAIANIVQREGKPLSELLSAFHAFPQRLLNVPVTRKPAFDSIPAIAKAAKLVDQELGSAGRLVLRYSGTEPLARIMIEAEDEVTVLRLTESLAQVIREALS